MTSEQAREQPSEQAIEQASEQAIEQASDQESLVERLYATLVEEIRARRPEYVREPFTVAEIYQDLVPYRSHRDRIGAAMNGDYEHALLRLLAGEGGYLSLESEPAKRRMQAELASPDPNTAIIREYAALGVRLNQALIPAEALEARSTARAGQDQDPPRTTGAPARIPAEPPEAQASPRRDAQGGGAAPEQGGVAAPAHPRAPDPRAPVAAATSGPAAPSAAEAGAATTCRWCREDLPEREGLRFCPYCGMDVKVVPCPSCGEELEPQWRFCIACGAHVAVED